MPLLRTRHDLVKDWPGGITGGLVMFLSSKVRSATQAMPSTQAVTGGFGVAVGALGATVGSGDGVGTGRTSSGSRFRYSLARSDTTPSVFSVSNAWLMARRSAVWPCGRAMA